MHRSPLHRRAVRLLLGSMLLLQLGGCTWLRTHLPASMGGISQDCAECRKTCDTANDAAACRAACDSGACRRPEGER